MQPRTVNLGLNFGIFKYMYESECVRSTSSRMTMQNIYFHPDSHERRVWQLHFKLILLIDREPGPSRSRHNLYPSRGPRGV